MISASRERLGRAEAFDPSLYANARERVLAYLATHERRWVTRQELRIVGGDEAMRRLRELRDDYDFPIEMRHLGHSQYVYRLLPE